MARKHYTKLDNGLALPWQGRIWLNPPYGRETFKWLERLADHKSGLALVFARTETRGFHDTINLPPELASAVLLLQEELKNQRKTLAASQRIMDIYADHLHIALQNCENCACCGKLFAKSCAHTVPAEDNIKVVCDNCFDAEYFDCHKCKRILPNSEQAEEDDQLGYGWICKDCTKPMGFPSEVVIAPDFEGCKDVAAADLSALCNHAQRSTGWMEPDSSDTIKLKLVEKLSEHDAIYENKNGLKYEIGKLDWRGIGSMQAAEDK